MVAERAEKFEDKVEWKSNIYKEIYSEAYSLRDIPACKASQLFLQSLLCGINSKFYFLDQRNRS